MDRLRSVAADQRRGQLTHGSTISAPLFGRAAYLIEQSVIAGYVMFRLAREHWMSQKPSAPSRYSKLTTPPPRRARFVPRNFDRSIVSRSNRRRCWCLNKIVPLPSGLLATEINKRRLR
jgi:hypothetical protein